MVLIRKWVPKNAPMTITMECPFYQELLCSENPIAGKLSRDFEAHALWQYYGLACAQYLRAKANIVDESELSEIFDLNRAKLIFQGVANNHGVKPAAMVRFWDMIERQRIAIGSDNVLPVQFKFRYWGH